MVNKKKKLSSSSFSPRVAPSSSSKTSSSPLTIDSLILKKDNLTNEEKVLIFLAAIKINDYK